MPKRKATPSQLWHDFQNTPAAVEPPSNHWVSLLALAVGEWRRNTKGKFDLVAPKEWTRGRRLELANDLLWALRFFQGQVWLDGEQLCVQPKELASFFAPLIKALKRELIVWLNDETNQ